MTTVRPQLLERVDRAYQPPPERIHFSIVCGFTVLLVVSLVIAASLLVPIARSVNTPSDPFAVYSPILPGESSENADAYGFDCHVHDTTSVVAERCLLRPVVGKVSSIQLFVSDDVIEGVVFNIQNGELTVGETLLMLGKPLRQRRRPFTSSWNMGNYHIVVSTNNRRFSYFVPIRAIQMWLSAA